MASRYYRQDDDRELAPAPVVLTCERCGVPVVLSDEEEDDVEAILCLACANGTTDRA